MSLTSMFRSAIDAVKFMFSPEQTTSADDLTDVSPSRVDAAMKAPITDVKPAVAAKKPRKPRTPKAPVAK